MKNIKVAFFDTKPYDRKSFDEANQNFGFELTYFEARLNPASAKMYLPGSNSMSSLRP